MTVRLLSDDLFREKTDIQHTFLALIIQSKFNKIVNTTLTYLTVSQQGNKCTNQGLDLSYVLSKRKYTYNLYNIFLWTSWICQTVVLHMNIFNNITKKHI